MNLASLRRESVEKLADEGLLSDTGNSQERAAAGGNALERAQNSQGRAIRGVPWFEEMIEGSELGRIKRRRGGQTSLDGRSKVEWEVVEYTSEFEDTASSTGKRKLDQVGREGDVEMRG